MATTKTTERTNQSVKTEKVDQLEFNDWNVVFNYKYTGEEIPQELQITGNKKEVGFVSVNFGLSGSDSYGFNFNPPSAFDLELIAKIHEEIQAIRS